jgi:hypothetical protein
MALPYTAGWTRLTASGVLGDSGQPVAIQGYILESGGTPSTTTYIMNGTAASSPPAIRLGGGVANAASAPGVTGQFPTTLAAGAYVSFDSNTSAVTVFWFKP